MSLATMPHRGRPGRIAGTRELILVPFIIVYRVRQETVEILRIYTQRAGLALIAAPGASSDHAPPLTALKVNRNP